MEAELYCPPAGKRVRIAASAADTDGDYVRFEMWLDPDSRGPYLHVHPVQDEVLAVVEGSIGVVVDGDKQVLGPGEEVFIERNVAHQFWNEADTETHLRGELRPARRADEFLPRAFALARDRWATKHGVPLNPLAVAALLDEYPDYYYFAYVPVTLQKLGVRFLAPLARLLGYDSDPGELPAAADRAGE